VCNEMGRESVTEQQNVLSTRSKLPFPVVSVLLVEEESSQCRGEVRVLLFIWDVQCTIIDRAKVRIK
jgi:hypothetical protein